MGRGCEHGRQLSQCKDCGGSGICEHGRMRGDCKECKVLGIGGSQICEHNRARAYCKECGGSQICEHNRRKSCCRECKGTSVCEHRNQSYACSICKPESVYKKYLHIEKTHEYGGTPRGSLPEDFVSLEEFCELIKLPCWLCQRTPEQVGGMGLDRINNNLGHVSGNLEAACWLCNRMRGNLSKEEFLKHLTSLRRFL